MVKVYITLEGDLEGVGEADVEFKVEQSRWDSNCSMLLELRGAKQQHRLYVEKLQYKVDPEGSKFRISKKTSKVIVTLKKATPEYWHGLRAPNALPYRRGGGGPPR